MRNILVLVCIIKLYILYSTDTSMYTVYTCILYVRVLYENVPIRRSLGTGGFAVTNIVDARAGITGNKHESKFGLEDTRKSKIQTQVHNT